VAIYGIGLLKDIKRSTQQFFLQKDLFHGTTHTACGVTRKSQDEAYGSVLSPPSRTDPTEKFHHPQRFVTAFRHLTSMVVKLTRVWSIKIRKGMYWKIIRSNALQRSQTSLLVSRRSRRTKIHDWNAVVKKVIYILAYSKCETRRRCQFFQRASGPTGSFIKFGAQLIGSFQKLWTLEIIRKFCANSRNSGNRDPTESRNSGPGVFVSQKFLRLQKPLDLVVMDLQEFRAKFQKVWTRCLSTNSVSV
jgi:hypothetical protein